MKRKAFRNNERAQRLNPSLGGRRTGNPQLEQHGRGEVRLPKRQRAPRKSERKG